MTDTTTITNSDPGDEIALNEPDLRLFDLGTDVLSSTSLDLPHGVQLNTWIEIGRSIGTVTEAARWWLGDFLIYGDQHYGQDHTQIFDPDAGAAWSWETLRQYRWVSERVPLENRLPPDQLSWSHHRAVAVLEAHEQPEWLQKAIAENWSVRELKAAIKQSLEAAAEDADVATVPTAPFAEVTSLSSGRIGQTWDEEAHLMLCLYLGVTA